MPVYVYRGGRMVDKATGAPMNDGPWQPATPMVYGDLPGYQSPIDGRWIEGRRARAYDMQSNNCVDGNDMIPAGGRKLKNRRFAEKHGLTHLLEQ
jgi:hypothetical protein